MEEEEPEEDLLLQAGMRARGYKPVKIIAEVSDDVFPDKRLCSLRYFSPPLPRLSLRYTHTRPCTIYRGVYGTYARRSPIIEAKFIYFFNEL